MSLPSRHTRSRPWAALTEPRHARESIEPYASGRPSHQLTDDDVLLLSIWWVKMIEGDPLSFVADVASVFWALKGKAQEAEYNEPTAIGARVQAYAGERTPNPRIPRP